MQQAKLNQSYKFDDRQKLENKEKKAKAVIQDGYKFLKEGKDTFVIRTDRILDGKPLGDIWLDFRGNKSRIYGRVISKLSERGIIPTKKLDKEYSEREIIEKLKKYAKAGNKLIESRREEKKNIENWEYVKENGKVALWKNDFINSYVMIEHSNEIHSWFAYASNKENPKYSNGRQTIDNHPSRRGVTDSAIKFMKERPYYAGQKIRAVYEEQKTDVKRGFESYTNYIDQRVEEYREKGKHLEVLRDNMVESGRVSREEKVENKLSKEECREKHEDEIYELMHPSIDPEIDEPIWYCPICDYTFQDGW